MAVALSVVAIWGGDALHQGFHKALHTIWILTMLTWVLVPVLRRFSAVGEERGAERVLGTLGEVELVAVHGTQPEDEVDVRLRPGERAVLRRSDPD